MSLADHASQLLLDISPELEVEALVEHTGDDQRRAWDVLFPGNVLVEVHEESEPAKLVLVADLGVPQRKDLGAIHRLFLQYNYLWRDTGGVRIALEEPSGAAILLYDLPGAEPSRELLQAVLSNFARAAQAWTTVLATDDTASAALSDFDISNAALFIKA